MNDDIMTICWKFTLTLKYDFNKTFYEYEFTLLTSKVRTFMFRPTDLFKASDLSYI